MGGYSKVSVANGFLVESSLLVPFIIGAGVEMVFSAGRLAL
jgi:hypothetical protein